MNQEQVAQGPGPAQGPGSAQESNPGACSFSVHVRQYINGQLRSTKGNTFNAKIPPDIMAELFKRWRREMKEAESKYQEAQDAKRFAAERGEEGMEEEKEES